MPSLPSSQALRLSIGFTVDPNRFQVVLPYVCDNPLPLATALSEDMDDFVATQFKTLWAIAAAADCHLVGYSYDGWDSGAHIVPSRRNFGPTAFVGAVAGDSTPPQTSVLAVYHSSEQDLLAERLRTGKTFFGPGPESKWDSGITSDNANFTAWDNLASLCRDFVGASTGFHYTRVACQNSAVAGELFTATNYQLRQELFTQRRRMRPLF